MDIKDTEILVADGDGESGVFVQRSLRDMGLARSTLVANGYTALVALKKTPIDIMLVDQDLPKIDAFGLVAEIRKMRGVRAPRIILMTVEASRESIRQAVDLGISEYLIKPFTPQVLKQKVESALSKRIPGSEPRRRGAEVSDGAYPTTMFTSLSLT